MHNEILPLRRGWRSVEEHVAPPREDVDVKLLHTLKSILNNMLANVFHIVCSRHHNLQTFMCFFEPSSPPSVSFSGCLGSALTRTMKKLLFRSLLEVSPNPHGCNKDKHTGAPQKSEHLN